MEQFREWIINPDSFQRWNEKMIYDAYSDVAAFTEFPDDDTKKYLREKEKTVSDTIQFVGDVENALKSILLSFNNSTAFDAPDEPKK